MTTIECLCLHTPFPLLLSLNIKYSIPRYIVVVSISTTITSRRVYSPTPCDTFKSPYVLSNTQHPLRSLKTPPLSPLTFAMSPLIQPPQKRRHSSQPTRSRHLSSGFKRMPKQTFIIYDWYFTWSMSFSYFITIKMACTWKKKKKY